MSAKVTSRDVIEFFLGTSHEQGLHLYWQSRLYEREQEYDFSSNQSVYNEAEKWMNVAIVKRMHELQLILNGEHSEKMAGLMATPKPLVTGLIDWNYPQC